MIDTKIETVLHYSAFTRDPDGGNRAGIVLDATEWSDEDMQTVATAVGYSETVFVTGTVDGGLEVRYFSPAAEVPFCGHATIALAVALADRQGPGKRTFITRSGPVPIETVWADDGMVQATLMCVAPGVTKANDVDLVEALDTLGWTRADLHPDLPPRVSFAGASHLILVAGHRQRLDTLAYDYERLKALLDRAGWTTVHLAYPEQMEHEHIVRNAFPAGPVREDPATGAAAAAYGAYLREFGAVTLPARLRLRQSEVLGRPSLLHVDIGPGNGGIRVSGNAVALRSSTSGPS